MSANKVLASFSYFSMFFAPFLFPLLVFIFTERPARSHAGKAFLLHLTIVATAFFGLALGGVLTQTSDANTAGFTVMAVFLSISIICAIWNVIKGILVLTQAETN